jgi:hypothetical protein
VASYSTVDLVAVQPANTHRKLTRTNDNVPNIVTPTMPEVTTGLVVANAKAIRCAEFEWIRARGESDFRAI